MTLDTCITALSVLPILPIRTFAVPKRPLQVLRRARQLRPSHSREKSRPLRSLMMRIGRHLIMCRRRKSPVTPHYLPAAAGWRRERVRIISTSLHAAVPSTKNDALIHALAIPSLPMRSSIPMCHPAPCTSAKAGQLTTI